MSSLRGVAGSAALLLIALPIVSSQSLEAAETEPLRLDIPAEEMSGSVEEWYGIYANDAKLGYLRSTIDLDPDAAGHLVVENEMHLKVVTLGQKREIKSLELLRFQPESPYRLISGTARVDQGDFAQEIELVPNGANYDALIRAAGDERAMTVENLDYTIADILTPERWFQQDRQPGEALSARSFSLTDLSPAVDNYTVVSLKETVVDGVPLSYYEVQLHSSEVGSIGTALIDVEGQLVSGVIGGAFELRRETAELARDFDYTADIYLLGMAAVDEPLGDPREVAWLVLGVDGRDPTTIPSGARQSMHFDEETGVWELALGAAFSSPPEATAEEITEALSESVEHPIHHPEIRGLARQAVGDAETRAEQVQALVGFVDTYLADSYSAEPLTVLDILDTRKGDCTEHALLFTTLARALEIPTREVSGLLYLGDDVQAFGGHAWNEVVIDGHWQPIDATWGEVEINATHILLGPRTGEKASAEAIFGDYEFSVLEIGHR
jgi:hypothetical protein